jgi:phosphatidylethanolamine-binding protein (PEBP) family uncharacterized protein
VVRKHVNSKTGVLAGAVLALLLVGPVLAACGGSSSSSSYTGASVAQTTKALSSTATTQRPPNGTSVSSGSAHAGPPGARAKALSRRPVADPKSRSTSGAQPVDVVAKAYEPKLPPGSMELTGAAFAGEGPIALQYTCAGANISPPLEWKNLPAKTAALILVITLVDDAGSSVRWVVANISPSPASVAEGKTPEGAVVGLNAEGHSKYGGICPPHEQASTVQVELFALSKKLSLSEGFQLATAAQEYNSEKLLLGATATKAVNAPTPTR